MSCVEASAEVLEGFWFDCIENPLLSIQEKKIIFLLKKIFSQQRAKEEILKTIRLRTNIK